MQRMDRKYVEKTVLKNSNHSYFYFQTAIRMSRNRVGQMNAAYLMLMQVTFNARAQKVWSLTTLNQYFIDNFLQGHEKFDDKCIAIGERAVSRENKKCNCGSNSQCIETEGVGWKCICNPGYVFHLKHRDQRHHFYFRAKKAPKMVLNVPSNKVFCIILKINTHLLSESCFDLQVF